MPEVTQTTLEAAVLDTEDRAARFDGILGAIRDFAKGRPQADAWEEIVRIALHDQDDADPLNDPEPPHLLADWVSSELAVARAAGQVEGLEMLRPRVIEAAEELEALWGRGVVLHSAQVGAILPTNSVGWWYVAMQGPHFGWLSHALLEDYGPVSVLAVPPTPETEESDHG